MTLIFCDYLISLVFNITFIRHVHYRSNRSTTIFALYLIYVVLLEKYGNNIPRSLGQPCCVALKRYGIIIVRS